MLVNVKKSTKRGSDGDLAASPTKKIHDNIETANDDNHNGFSLKTLKNKYSESKVLIMLPAITMLF